MTQCQLCHRGVCLTAMPIVLLQKISIPPPWKVSLFKLSHPLEFPVQLHIFSYEFWLLRHPSLLEFPMTFHGEGMNIFWKRPLGESRLYIRDGNLILTAPTMWQVSFKHATKKLRLLLVQEVLTLAWASASGQVLISNPAVHHIYTLLSEYIDALIKIII